MIWRHGDTVKVSVKSLSDFWLGRYNRELKYVQLQHTTNDKGEFYDLLDKDGYYVCNNNENCKILDVDRDNRECLLTGGFAPATFRLTFEEMETAVYSQTREWARKE